MTASAWEIIRAIRGPVMLITFGTLMALNHVNKIGFERTWPILIIVLAFLQLIERLVARHPVPPPWPPPGTSVPYTAAPPYSQPQPPQTPPHYPQGGAK